MEIAVDRGWREGDGDDLYISDPFMHGWRRDRGICGSGLGESG